MAQVSVRREDEQHRYVALLDDAPAGFAAYSLRPGIIEFTHTEIDEAFEGHGVGSTLARAALDDVRRDGTRRVVASCPFVAAYIERHPDYQDLLAD